ncbi:hypothetical protein Alg130_02840 [Pyrenophora tritici-repentis]|nr:hypothetical protein Alg130_02840 [Pyrenophora tritici-repentis]
MVPESLPSEDAEEDYKPSTQPDADEDNITVGVFGGVQDLGEGLGEGFMMSGGLGSIGSTADWGATGGPAPRKLSKTVRSLEIFAVTI